MSSNILKNINIALMAFLLIAGVFFLPVFFLFQGSLSILEGQISLAGVKAPLTILRDIKGVPTIKASNREDTAYALGFLHGQERFFQMDLLRRTSAGELSDLFGNRAIRHDKKIRLHQFRKRATDAFENMPPAHQQILSHYTMGVNQGLEALGQLPFEYFLLQGQAQPWQVQDGLLVLYSMYIDLQPIWGQSERSLAVMKDLLPKDWFTFLTSQGGYWDSPIEGPAYKENTIIPIKPLSLFQEKSAPQNHASANTDRTRYGSNYTDKIHYGSNNWSVSGVLTSHGAGMVANDMHLGLGVPNIWYRASWYLEDGRRITGVSLPGTPAMIAGSNERVAWGFTNSQGDYSDVIILKTREPNQYLTPQGWQEFIIESEKIQVKGKDAIEVKVKKTQWGPVIGKDHNGSTLALRWVAHDVQGANMNILGMEDALDIKNALAIAPLAGIPGQNLNVVDHQGKNAWSIMGRLPNRFGFSKNNRAPYFFDSQLPKDWSQGRYGWQGYLSKSDYPKVVNPNNGRIWTANARVASGINLAKVGVNNYALGARQKQIQQGLQSKDIFTELDFLEMQLDDKAVFLTRWQILMLSILEHEGIANLNSDLINIKHHLENWQGRASESSVGYLLVKRFRERVINQTIGHVYRYLEKNSNDFWPSSINNFVEYPVWLLMKDKPAKHLPNGFTSWQDFLMAMIKQSHQQVTQDGKPLNEQTWGKHNTLAIKHPLSGALPFLSSLLNMPAHPMAGDTYMPRVQDPNTGASERFSVAPGFEKQGYFHMATGQSAHPLSPYFKRGHDDWVAGRATPFLPQQTQWTLKISPPQP